jgi:hypothetical protein
VTDPEDPITAGIRAIYDQFYRELVEPVLKGWAEEIIAQYGDDYERLGRIQMRILREAKDTQLQLGKEMPRETVRILETLFDLIETSGMDKKLEPPSESEEDSGQGVSSEAAEVDGDDSADKGGHGEPNGTSD